MVSSVLVAGGAILAWLVYSIISGLRGNIRKAQKTGVPYVVSRKFVGAAAPYLDPFGKDGRRVWLTIFTDSCSFLQHSVAGSLYTAYSPDQKIASKMVGELAAVSTFIS